MQIHELRPFHKPKRRKRVGRGGKKGTYSGRGIKGQYPKLRGYKFKSVKEKPEVINVDVLEKYFQKGKLVTPKVLLERGLISKIKGRIPKIKILARGKITKSLTIENFLVSKKAKEKIEKAGGKVK